MKAFAICWRDQYLHKVGNSDSCGLYWTKTLSEARLYPSEKDLDKHLLQAARACPNGGPWPSVLEVEVTIVKRIVNDDRFQKNRERALKAEATRRANWSKVRQKEAEQEIARLERDLKWARERLRDEA